MMPELGKYAFAVLSSYGVTIVLLSVIVLASVRRARKVRAALDEIESRRGS
ncbi:heme exporter protein CcmD [Marivita sp.]|uniref:heme exporter protein CcmD n=1 Tax=Marivita sp. TaxID=2003365 RepID=UPI00321B6787